MEEKYDEQFRIVANCGVIQLLQKMQQLPLKENNSGQTTIYKRKTVVCPLLLLRLSQSVMTLHH